MKKRKESEPEEIVLFALAPQLCLACMRMDLAPRVRFRRAVYERVAAPDVSGFFDWLRNRADRVLGIRFWPGFERAELRALCKDLPYAGVAADSHCIELFISGDRRYDASRSDDQDFGGNTIYRSPEHKYIITAANTSGLSIDDWRGLTHTGFEWGKFSPVMS